MKNNISVQSRLFKFGIGVFETIKILNKPIDIDKHVNRVYNSMIKLEINNIPKEYIKKYIIDYIDENKIKNKVLRITIFDEGFNISTRDISYTNEMYKKGVSLTISDIIRSENILYRHKTTNYFENIYSKEKANKNGFFDAIFVNNKNEILETSISNIFFIKNETIFTPKSTQPILNGIMKDKVKQICNYYKIDYIEKEIDLDEIKQYDACFITNSIMGAMKVNKIDSCFYDYDNEVLDKISKKIRDMEKENEY